ncbi:hypothetical protein SAMN05216269_1255 [Flavobacterium xinjiangense]|uniref:Uncharacterized protein n=1 Tax=Flavobacterium xinjiangense TaxID=178356 RepID=A0A1M7PVY7_9FLAO|nr:hypothetical protein SAMN05216269_1255 [Flavobacterium xinjiangense]
MKYIIIKRKLYCGEQYLNSFVHRQVIFRKKTALNSIPLFAILKLINGLKTTIFNKFKSDKKQIYPIKYPLIKKITIPEKH